MKSFQQFLQVLFSSPNPFGHPVAYTVPQRGDQAGDMASIARDFRPVFANLTRTAQQELNRHVVAAN